MRNHKSKEANDKSEKILNYISENGENGVSIKDISIAFNMPAETVRHYVKALYTNGYITRKRQGYGSAHRYFWKKPEDQTQNVMEDEDKTAMGGVEREPDTVIKCGEFCKPGDVVECSSRSGEGLYFKYLVLIPWERKAMVIGIFPEGHPNLNLNDPNHIYIGDDPESGNKLYVDITNVCQRGYKTFGKRLFHAEKANMDEVKSRLKRALQLDSAGLFGGNPSAKMQVENNRLKEDNRTLKKIRAESSNKIKDLEDELETSKRELKIQCMHYEQEIGELKHTLSVTSGAVNEYAAIIEKQNNELKSLELKNKELQNKLIKTSGENGTTEPEYDPNYVEGLEAKYGDALIKLKAAETRVEDYDYFTDVMKDFVMNLINKGGN